MDGHILQCYSYYTVAQFEWSFIECETEYLKEVHDDMIIFFARHIVLVSALWRHRLLLRGTSAYTPSIRTSRNYHRGLTASTLRYTCLERVPKPEPKQAERKALSNATNSSFEDCWAATSWTVNAGNDDDVNEVVRCFNSPAPSVYFALTRALEGTSVQDQLEVFCVFTFLLKKGYRFVVQYNIHGDNDTAILDWRIAAQESTLEPAWHFVEGLEELPNTLQISHRLLDMVTEASECHTPVDPDRINALVDLAIQRLDITLGTDIRGRSSADAAFTFAMAGVVRPQLYQKLTMIARLELGRIGPRPSFPSKSILQIVEKLAAAGLQSGDAQPTYKLAAELLEMKNEGHYHQSINALRSSGKGAFGLHSKRSLLWLWRFAARQSKAKLPTQDSSTPPSDSEGAILHTSMEGDRAKHPFEDPSRALIVDVGCGLGVSLLGLAHAGQTDTTEDQCILSPLSTINFRQCNFLGGDLSQLLVRYSSGIAHRWGLQGKTAQFTYQSAEDLIRQVQEYRGPIALIMIQFPTPFRLANKIASESNSQLPTDVASGFMVTPNLLRDISGILQKQASQQRESGYLLLQSNCEDVAVAMRYEAVKSGLECVDAITPVMELLEDEKLPQRTKEWIKLDGHRPIGREWSATPFLPRVGQTETEVACEFQGTPVHRCLLRAPRLPRQTGSKSL